jgi:hypothetical protein
MLMTVETRRQSAGRRIFRPTLPFKQYHRGSESGALERQMPRTLGRVSRRHPQAVATFSSAACDGRCGLQGDDARGLPAEEIDHGVLLRQIKAELGR